MKLFLDTAKINEIEHALFMWNIDGITTNPRHIKESGENFASITKRLAKLLTGTKKVASIQVDPNLVTWRMIVNASLEIAGISPNFVVKIIANEEGYRAIRVLTNNYNIKVNTTLIFSETQAWHAARNGTTYISPFVGWKETYGDKSSLLIKNIKTILDNYNYKSQIIAAAIRNSYQISEAAKAGAHCVTAKFQVYKDSFDNPYTTRGELLFQEAFNLI